MDFQQKSIGVEGLPVVVGGPPEQSQILDTLPHRGEHHSRSERLRAGFASCSHLLTSDRSQPPQGCLSGKRPRFLQRNRVDRFTPTTRRTSAVLSLWSSGETRSGGGLCGIGRRSLTDERGGTRRRASCCGGAARSRTVSAADVHGVNFERIGRIKAETGLEYAAGQRQALGARRLIWARHGCCKQNIRELTEQRMHMQRWQS